MVQRSRAGDANRTMIAFYRGYGSLVRTEANEVSVADVAGIKKIHGAGSRSRNHLSVTARHRRLRELAACEVAARCDHGSNGDDVLSKLLAVHRE